MWGSLLRRPQVSVLVPGRRLVGVRWQLALLGVAECTPLEWGTRRVRVDVLTRDLTPGGTLAVPILMVAVVAEVEVMVTQYLELW